MTQEQWITFGIGLACGLIPSLIMASSYKRALKLVIEQQRELKQGIVDNTEIASGSYAILARILATVDNVRADVLDVKRAADLNAPIEKKLLIEIEEEQEQFTQFAENISKLLTDISNQTAHIPVRGADGKFKKQKP